VSEANVCGSLNKWSCPQILLGRLLSESRILLIRLDPIRKSLMIPKLERVEETPYGIIIAFTTVQIFPNNPSDFKVEHERIDNKDGLPAWKFTTYGQWNHLTLN
jgi:hypothetical protein